MSGSALVRKYNGLLDVAVGDGLKQDEAGKIVPPKGGMEFDHNVFTVNDTPTDLGDASYIYLILNHALSAAVLPDGKEQGEFRRIQYAENGVGGTPQVNIAGKFLTVPDTNHTKADAVNLGTVIGNNAQFRWDVELDAWIEVDRQGTISYNIPS